MSFFLNTSFRHLSKNARTTLGSGTRSSHRLQDTICKRKSFANHVCVTSGALGCSFASYWLWTEYEISKLEARPLSPSYFSPSTLSSTEIVNPKTKLLRISLNPEVTKTLQSLPPVWSVYVKDSDIQVERPYTPLEGVSTTGEMAFWVKKYPHGEVGRWLHSKSLGERIEIRGPEQTFPWEENKWDNVIMISGGTGVAPFFQLLNFHFSKSESPSKTKFTLLHSYRSPREFPPTSLLDTLSSWESQDSGKLKVRTFVDALEDTQPESEIRVGRISKSDVESEITQCSGKTIVLVCGPDTMINAVAGPKNRDNSQGPVGGMLKEIQNTSFHVWKL